ncbi:hypothetical protein [Sphingomonas sp. NFR15]|uniref:hypothetical protein n=1 Tax=Sphingomonas sp. NFR15 TaxID=1566282 RepID=UPI00088D534E|nr:hypothetical protein [Sphingomonas sp. NFR15]SDA25122.1 hypothetical protein SAMN03159340_01832 [Sphingomonas sp. NFR15]
MDVNASRRQRDGRRAWIGLVLPPLAWICFEYGAGVSLRGACAAIGGWAGLLWGVASLAVCGAAAWIARSAAVAARNPPTSSWLARIATFGAGMFALAIMFQTVATMIVPGCAR